MDVLSETLKAVRLSGAVFFNARFTAPWGYDSPPADAVAPVLAPHAERVVIFHMVTEGECFVDLDDGEGPTRLTAGDVIVFPQGDAHRMYSQPGARPPAKPAPLAALLARAPRLITSGGGGEATRLVCGYLACDARLGRMLMSGLPSLVRVNIRDSDAGGWLEASLRYALSETRARRPGGSGVLAKLSELLFMEVLRMQAEQQEARTGWLAGLRDRVVGAALSALHVRPAHGWTLEELARTVGASRSVLAERFQRLLGVSPMQYLIHWRMMLAANMLRESDAQLLDIAMDVGYQTDTAFIRAFRREFGAPPAQWRRAQAAAAA